MTTAPTMLRWMKRDGTMMADWRGWHLGTGPGLVWLEWMWWLTPPDTEPISGREPTKAEAMAAAEAALLESLTGHERAAFLQETAR